MDNTNVTSEVKKLRENRAFDAGLDLKFDPAKDVKTGIIPQVMHSESRPFFRGEK